MGAWSELHSEQAATVGFAEGDRVASDAALTTAEFGPLRIARLHCRHCTIERTPHHLAEAADRSYTLILQARGSGLLRQYGHEAALGAGDLTLCHGEAPYTYRLAEDCEVVMLRVPAHLLAEHLPSPQSFCAHRLPASEGLTRAAAVLIGDLCAPSPPAAIPGELRHRIARHLLSVIATSYAIAFDSKPTASSNVSTLQARAKLYIEQHLRQPDLTPCSIARALRLSPRYLRMIFASGNETVSAYILRRRLEQCARQIEDPRWSGRSITEIAFSWGFNSAPHFTRSFRGRYGTSPRRYRHLRGQKPTAAEPLSASIDLASAGVATSRPSSPRILRTFLT
jgi:AraC-like DNA-binding protein